MTDSGLVTWPLCAPCSSVKGGKKKKISTCWMSPHTKGFHHCFHATSRLAPALDLTAESRQAPHRSPLHGFGQHHEGVALEFHLHSLHQPREGKGGSAFHLASGVGQGASDWQAGPGCAVPKPGLLQSPLCHLRTILALLLCARAAPAITEPTQDCHYHMASHYPGGHGQ